MKNNFFKLLWNPFERIAGAKALGWGVLGLIVVGVLNYLFQWHYHGLLHFGPAPNSAFWCFLAEQFVVWLIPASIFYTGSLLLSKSKVRAIDIYGTTAFALLPFIIMNLIYYLPVNDVLRNLDPTISPTELILLPGFFAAIAVSMFSLIFLVWVLIWMYKALKVSSNLKGRKLFILYIAGVVGGDIMCRMIINQFY